SFQYCLVPSSLLSFSSCCQLPGACCLLLKPQQQFFTNQFQALFEPVVLKSQIKNKVFHSARAKFFDLARAIIRVTHDQQPFQILDGPKFSREWFDPMSASLRALRKRLHIDTGTRFFAVRLDPRDRNISQSNFSVGQLSQILYSIIEGRQWNTSGNPAIAIFGRAPDRGASTAATEDRNRFNRLGLDRNIFK